MSYSPFYNQNIIWVAEYNDGSLLREWDDSGKEHLFKEIDRDKLRKFHCISSNFDYFINCDSGVFTIDNREFVFPLTGLDLNYASGLIHYKEAFTEFKSRPTHSYDGFSIASYHVGWKITSGNLKSQIVFNVTEKVFTIELTFLDLQKTIKWKLKI